MSQPAPRAAADHAHDLDHIGFDQRRAGQLRPFQDPLVELDRNPSRVHDAAEAATILGWSELVPALEAAASIKRTSRVKHALRAALVACTK